MSRRSTKQRRSARFHRLVVASTVREGGSEWISGLSMIHHRLPRSRGLEAFVRFLCERIDERQCTLEERLRDAIDAMFRLPSGAPLEIVSPAEWERRFGLELP